MRAVGRDIESRIRGVLRTRFQALPMAVGGDARRYTTCI